MESFGAAAQTPTISCSAAMTKQSERFPKLEKDFDGYRYTATAMKCAMSRVSALAKGTLLCSTKGAELSVLVAQSKRQLLIWSDNDQFFSSTSLYILVCLFYVCFVSRFGVLGKNAVDLEKCRLSLRNLPLLEIAHPKGLEVSDRLLFIVLILFLFQIWAGLRWVQASCGFYHTAVLDENGEVFLCGRNAYGK